jgi:hypothetical protein
MPKFLQRRPSMAKKDKTQAQAEIETLHLILNELKPLLARSKTDPSHENETDTFIRGIHAGYEDGLKRAIEIVNYQIGIRLDPPDIFYGMEEKPGPFRKPGEIAGV